MFVNRTTHLINFAKLSIGCLFPLWIGGAAIGQTLQQVTITVSYTWEHERLRPNPIKAGATNNLSIQISKNKVVIQNEKILAGQRVIRFDIQKTLGKINERNPWRILSGNRLQRQVDFPQNITIETITIGDTNCDIDVQYKLKPGYKEYMFRQGANREWGYYTKPRVVSKTCEIR